MRKDDGVVRNLYRLIRDFSEEMKKQNISAFAASTAFFLFLSLVPMLIVICTVIPLTPLTQENLMTAVIEITPDIADALVVKLISEIYEQSTGLLSIAAVTTLWSAGKGVLALMRGLNAINDTMEHRNYIVIRLISSMYTVVMLIATILSLFVMVFGNQMVDLILYKIPQLRTLFSFLMNFRFLAIWFVLTILFSVIYAYVPDKKLKFKDQIPGASFAAVIWSMYSWGFSVFVRRSNSYTVYGSLSIIIIIMVWMYACMYLIMVGAYINRYLEEENLLDI